MGNPSQRNWALLLQLPILLFSPNPNLIGELTPLTFEEIQKYKEFLKTHGIQQFCRHYNKIKDKNYETLKWGDEVSIE